MHLVLILTSGENFIPTSYQPAFFCFQRRRWLICQFQTLVVAVLNLQAAWHMVLGLAEALELVEDLTTEGFGPLKKWSGI
jgi:hypothetical protein